MLPWDQRRTGPETRWALVEHRELGRAQLVVQPVYNIDGIVSILCVYYVQVIGGSDLWWLSGVRSIGGLTNSSSESGKACLVSCNVNHRP